MEAMPGLIAYQYCRKFGRYVTFTIPCQEDKQCSGRVVQSLLSDDVGSSKAAVETVASSQRRKERARLTEVTDGSSTISSTFWRNLGFDGGVEKTLGRCDCACFDAPRMQRMLARILCFVGSEYCMVGTACFLWGVAFVCFFRARVAFRTFD